MDFPQMIAHHRNPCSLVGRNSCVHAISITAFLNKLLGSVLREMMVCRECMKILDIHS